MLKEKFLSTINKYEMLDKHDKNILVAVSGGFDSTCLLYLLNELKDNLNINLYIAHINHCIRDNAIIDEEYVKELGNILNIPVYVKRFDVETIAKEQKISTEMSGRNVRYEFFEQLAKELNCSKIATAHNANDNAETILLNLFRGTGLNGLKGIQKIRDDKYIRPLLEITRAEIDEYLEQNNIQARKDESNDENIYRRNMIRNEVIPYIKKNFNDNIISTLNRMSDVISQDAEYMNNVTNEIFEKVLLEKNSDNELILDAKKINEHETVIKKRLILKAIETLNDNTQNIEQVHVNDIIKMIERNVGNKYLTPNKFLKVYINGGKVHFVKKDLLQ